MSDYQIASFFVCGAAHTALTLRVDGQKEYALRPGTRICVEGHGRGTYVSKARLEVQDEGFLFSSTPKHIISFDSGEFCETIQLRNTMQCHYSSVGTSRSRWTVFSNEMAELERAAAVEGHGIVWTGIVRQKHPFEDLGVHWRQMERVVNQARWARVTCTGSTEQGDHGTYYSFSVETKSTGASTHYPASAHRRCT